MDDVPFVYCVHDCRVKSELKSMTLTGYKRSEVIKAMSKAIINSKVDESNRWSIELLVSGYTDYIFDELFLVYINYININNPYYLFYFLRRRRYYNQLISSIPKKIHIYIRNNQEIRNLVAELVNILVYSKKNNLFEKKGLPKIPIYAFEYKFVKQKVISNSTHNILNYLDDKDLTEIKIALNEIINILYSNKKTFTQIIFWYIWLKKFIKEFRKTNIEREISKRYEINEIEEKYKNDWIWSMWKIILDYSTHKNKIEKQYIQKLFIEYKRNYKGYEKSNKNSIILYTFYILTNNINYNINIRQQEKMLILANCTINSYYSNIEKSLIRNYTIEEENNRHKKYNLIILKENTKLKKKIERENMKKLKQKKALIQQNNLKKLNSYREFIPYKKKEDPQKLKSTNIKNYFVIEPQRKTINIENKKIDYSNYNISLEK